MVDIKKAPDGRVPKEIIDFLVDIPMFDDLHPQELNTVARYTNYIEVKAGDHIFKEGDKGEYVCFVTSGSLDVLKMTETGGNVIIATLAKGSSIGEMSVIDEYPRSATVRARTQATFLTLTRTGFDSILKEYPNIGIKILKGISRKLSLNLRQTSSRLADFMLPVS